MIAASARIPAEITSRMPRLSYSSSATAAMRTCLSEAAPPPLTAAAHIAASPRGIATAYLLFALPEAFGLDLVAALTGCFLAAGFIVGFLAAGFLAACFGAACFVAAGGECLT